MKKEIIVIACIFFIVLANSFSIITNSVFKEMQWTVFNYEFGFIKRGLIGEILRLVCGKPDRGLVIALSSGVAAAAVSALSYFYLRPCAKAAKHNILHVRLFSLLALSHFATLQFTIFDTGRFDQFGILLMALSIVTIERLQGIKVTAAIILLSTLGILIHEAYFFLFFPLVFSYWVFKDEKKIDKILTLTLILALVVYVGHYGNLKSTINRHDYINFLVSKYGSWVSEQPVWILYTTTPQHIRVATRNFSVLIFYQLQILWLIALVPTTIIIQKMFKLLYATLSAVHNQKKKKTIITLLFLSPFTPLLLYFLGLDFGRWFSITIINILVLLSIFLYSNESFMRRCSVILEKKKKVLITAIVISLLLGPLAKNNGFIWNLGYPPVARSCLNAARLYYGAYDATRGEIRDKVAQTISSW
jgi:hypothetical protein